MVTVSQVRTRLSPDGWARSMGTFVTGQELAVLPETLIIGSLAQTGACALLTLSGFVGKTAYFSGSKAAEFMCPVYPGEVLELEVKLEKIKSSIGSGKATAKVDGQVVCLAELTFMIG